MNWVKVKTLNLQPLIDWIVKQRTEVVLLLIQCGLGVYVACLMIPDALDRENPRAFIERNAIALLSSPAGLLDPPTKFWLGNSSPPVDQSTRLVSTGTPIKGLA